MLDKSAGSNHKELSQQLLVAAESKKKLEDTVKGLEGKLSFAEQEKLQLQKVCVILIREYVVFSLFESVFLYVWYVLSREFHPPFINPLCTTGQSHR